MMMFSMVNSMLAVDVPVSEPLLVGFLAVLVILIVLLAILATIYTAGFRRRLRASLSKVTVDRQYDRALGRVLITDTNNLEKSVFGGGDTVRVVVRAKEGFKIAHLTVENKDGHLFAVNGEDKNLKEGFYEFVISADTKIKVQFDVDPAYVAHPEVFTFDELYNGVGGRVVMTDVNGEERKQFAAGETVRISTIADEGYYLSRFAINGEDRELIEGVYEFVILQPIKVDVEFLPVPVEPEVFNFDEVFNGEGGKVVMTDANGEEKNQFAAGETVRISTIADEGYYLSRFAINGEEKELVEGVYEFVVTEPVKIDVEFALIPQPEVISITTQFDGIGGRVIFSDVNGEDKGQYVAGETVKISTIADEGYYLSRFAINGEEKELVEGVYEFVVTEPIEVAIEFLPVPVTKYNVTAQAGDNGLIAVTNDRGEEQYEFVSGEIVRIATVPNDGYYASHLIVNGEEFDVNNDLYEFVIGADTFISATFEAIPVVVEEPVKEEVVVADVDDDEDEEDEVMFDGHNVIRFNKSFTAKFIQLNDVSKAWYTELKNELLSYKKVKDRMSWKRESYRFGRENVARLVIRGKTLCIQLPLDPTQFEETKYKVEDISHIMSSADTPCLYRIKNERRLEYAKDLIAMVMEKLGSLDHIEREWVDYYQPHDTTLNLIDKGLVKKIVKFNGKTGFGGIVEKLTEDPTKVQETEAAATTDESNDKK